jgi:hypothetical protein
MLITLANVTLFIQLIISYKCASHNRLTAYRNLIAAERFDEKVAKALDRQGPYDPAVAFDVCMDHLNHTYAEGVFDFNVVRGEFYERKGVFRKLKGSNDIDLFVSEAFPKHVKFKGIEGIEYGRSRHSDNVWWWLAIPFFLFCLMPGFYKRKGTWQFPDHVNRMIGFIVLAELSVAGFFFFKNSASWGDNPLSFFALVTQFGISLILLQQVSLQWQELMIGGKRIFSYFVQFVPFRMIYIKQMFGFDGAEVNGSQDPEHITYFVGTEWELEN